MLNRLRGKSTPTQATAGPGGQGERGGAPVRPGDPPRGEGGAHDAAPAEGRHAEGTTGGGAVERERAGAGPGAARGGPGGGFQLGAAFFGWLVAVGITVLLTALLSAIGASIGLDPAQGLSPSNAGQAAIGGAIAALVILLVAYFAGGYVAGRLSRFDGGRQGAGVWVISIVVAILLAVIGAVLGAQYNVLSGVGMPRVPTDPQDLAIGSLITLIVVLLGTLLAAVLGGKAGQRYHTRIDRASGLHA